MANLMLDFMKGFASGVAPESLSELKSDADTIRETIMGGARTAQDKYREIRRSPFFKKTTDWFFRRGSEIGEGSTLDDDHSDEFDAGFKYGADDDKSDDTPKVLDYEGMKGLAKGQVSSMYQIAGKQTEASAMTASEIITTINTRSSEILSSLGNINSSLQTISGKLDKLIELNAVATRERSRYQGIFDSSGNITLGNTFNYIKQNNPLMEYADYYNMIAPNVKMMFDGTFEMSKSEAVGNLAGLTFDFFGDKRMKVLDNRSIHDIRDAVDERIYSAQNSLLSKLLDTNIFKKWFGDLTQRQTNTDYSKYISNQYNRDKAVFDNMTRKTIIDIIPGYLRRITAALTGETLYISSEGSLTTERSSEFQNQFSGAIQAGFNTKRFTELMESASDDIERNDVYVAQRVLVGLYTLIEMKESGKNIRGEDFESGGDPAINARAIDALVQSGTKDRDYWTKVVGLITAKLIADRGSREAFARTIRKGAISTHNRVRNYAENASVTYDIGELTDDIINNTIIGYAKRAAGKDDRTWNERVQAGEIKRWQIPRGVDPDTRASDEALRQARRQKIQQSEIINNTGPSFKSMSSLTIDYVASIFALLNRGVNVYAVHRNKRFAPMDLIHVNMNQTGPTITPTQQQEPEQTGSSGGETSPTAPVLEEINQQPSTGSAPGTIQSTINNVTSTIPAGFSQTVSNFMQPIKQMKDNVVTDVKSLWSSTVGTAGINYNRSMVQHGMSKLGDSESDKKDKSIADTVLAAMNAAVQDGDTKEDVGPLMQQIAQIQNPELKTRLTRVVEGTLQRADTVKPAQSKLGKILTWGLGLVKGFVLPKLQSAKTFIMSLGGKILTPIINSLKSSGQRITSGFGAIKSGFSGLISNAKDRRNEKRVAKLTSQLVDINETSSTPLSMPTTDITEDSLVSLDHKNEKDDSRTSTADPELKNEIKKIREDVAQQKEETKKGNGITRAMNNFVEKFKQTDFGRGFMSAFEKKARNKEMEPQTLSDQMSKSIFDILKSKDGNGSVFGTIISKISSIGDIFKENINKLTNKSETPATGTNANGGVVLEEINQQPTNMAQATDMTSTHVDATTMLSPINQQPTNMAQAATSATSATTAAAGAAKNGFSFNLGKILGGMTGILGGLLQAVMTIVLSMKGFKLIVNLIMKVLKNSLKPLNKAFRSIYKAIKPVMKTIQKILRQVVEYLVELVQSVIEIMQPIIEMIGPLLEEMMEALKPFLDLITDVVNKMIVPLTALMQVVVVPILQTISNSIEIIWGILEVGFGTVQTALGGILCVLGFIGKMFGAPSMFDTGAEMIEQGKARVAEGANHFTTGFKSQMALSESMLNGFKQTDAKTEETEETTRRRDTIVDTLNGSPMDGLYAAGDIGSIYGSAGANQNQFGNYMNMSARGCGPVALADAYARRSGSAVDARGLTSAMASAGAYNPSMGTSVAGFVNASNSMGMGLRAGGVTPASLKQATPNNPITIVGSGTDFTTRRGNNHYMNVVGSSGGTAYVSNPMNGRIERRSVTSLAANSLVGLYGSGNAVPGGYQDIYGSGDSQIVWSDEVQDALTTLKDLVSNIIGIFTGDDTLDSKLDKAKSQAAYDKTMIDLGSMTDEEKKALEDKAFEEFQKSKPRFENETDEEYRKRFEKSKDYTDYLAKAAQSNLYDATKKTAGSYDTYFNDMLGEIDAETGERTGGKISSFLQSMKEKDEAVQQGSFFTTLQDMIGYDDWEDEAEPGFYSDNGARLYTDDYDPSVFDTSDAVNWKKDKGYKPNIPLIEWLQYNMPEMLGMSSAYRRRGKSGADENVVGLDGEDHSGTDFFGPEGTRLIAPTDGVVIGKGTDQNDTKGYYLIMEDLGGDIHKFYHLQKPSTLDVGDDVWGGDPIGYIGSTGAADPEAGPHVHYEITTGDGAYSYNPHQFFKWYSGDDSEYANQGVIDITDGMNMTWTDPSTGQTYSSDIFSPYISSMPQFHRWAHDAGLTPAQEAYVAGVSLGEHGPSFSGIVDGTYAVNIVRNGHVGLSNWTSSLPDGSEDNTHGSTAQEQLKVGFIDNYFTDPPGHQRGYITNLDRYKQAMETVMGRDVTHGDGDPWAPILEDDLVQGTGFGVGSAVVPDDGVAEDIRTFMFAKDMGAAARYYNWLIEQGYIDAGGTAANLDYNLSSYNSEYESVTDSMAANSALQTGSSTTDDTSGVPTKYTASKSGSIGEAKNAADKTIFKYYIPSGQSIVDENAWYKSHSHVTKYIADINGKFTEVSVDLDSCTDTAKNYILGISSYGKKTNSDKKESQGTTTILPDADLVTAANSTGLKWTVGSKNGVPTYDGWTDPEYNITRYHSTRDWADKFWVAHGYSAAPNWDDRTMGIKFDSAIYKQGSGVSEGNNVVQKNKSMLKVFDDRGIDFWNKLRGYPNTKTAMKNAGLPSSQSYWYDKAGETYDSYYKGINTAYSTTGTFDQYPFKTVGGGDANIPSIYGGAGMTGQLTDMFSIDPYLQQQSPVVVNNYAVNSTGDDVIDTLMSNTYNVRSVQIESLLTGMLQMMKDRKNKKQSSSSKTRTSKQSKQDAAFPEQGIPRQVQRLSIG